MKGKLLIILLVGIFSFVSTKHVLAGEAPVQTNPLNKSTVTSSKLEWQAPSYQLYSSNPYRVQIDDSSSFSPVSSIYRDSYKTNTTYTPELTEGTWYWRIKARDIAGTWSDWSSIYSFTLQSNPSPTPIPTPSPTSTPSSSLTISNTPLQINSDQNFETEISLSLPNNTNTNFFLKGAFKKADGSNYFGLTKVNSDWVKNGTSYSEQYKVVTDSAGNWSGKLETKVDSEDSGFSGTGDYIFKVARYTETGSGPAWSNEVGINITQTETAQAKGSSTTPESNPSPSSSPGETSDQTSSSKANLKTASVTKLASVAAATIASNPTTPSSTTQTIIKNEKQINIVTMVGGLFVFVGISLSGYLYFRYKRM